MSGPDDWSDFGPLPVDDPTWAFGAMGMDLLRLAPMLATCPRVFENQTLWAAVVSQWFFAGLKRSDVFAPKDGIDKAAALRHVGAVLKSFEPEHNAKERVVAYLLSLWFDDFTPGPEHSEVFRNRVEAARRPSLGAGQ